MNLTKQQFRKMIRKMVKENLDNLGDKKATPFGKDKEEDKPTKSSKDFSSEKKDDIEECAGEKKLDEGLTEEFEGDKPESIYDRIPKNMRPFTWSTPADKEFKPWRVPHRQETEELLKKLFPAIDQRLHVYADFAERRQGKEQFYVGVRDNRDLDEHTLALREMAKKLKKIAKVRFVDRGEHQAQLFIVDDIERDALEENVELDETRTNFYGEDCGKPHKESSDLTEGIAIRFDLWNDFQGKAGLSDEDMLDALVRQMSDDEARGAFAYIARTHDLSSTLGWDINDRKTDRFEMLERVLEEFGEDHSMLLDAVVRQMSDPEAREAFEYLSRMYDVNAPVEEALEDKPIGKRMQSMQSPVAQNRERNRVGSKFQKNLPRVRPPAKQTMRIEQDEPEEINAGFFKEEEDGFQMEANGENSGRKIVSY
jgi:hypothetical protein